MAQIYPEDRGTNYAVRYGRRVAKQILEQFSQELASEETSGLLVGNRSTGV